MKQILIIFLLFCSVETFSQKIVIEKIGQTDYFVTSDTSDVGNITIVKTPVISIVDKLQQELTNINEKLVSIEDNIQRLRQKQRELGKKKHEIEKLIKDIDKSSTEDKSKEKPKPKKQKG